MPLAKECVPLKKLNVKAKIENYELCAAFIEEQLEEKGLDRKSIIKVITACEEIIVNVMNYAYSDSEGDLEITFDEGDDFIIITFIDNGTPFNPFDRPDVDVSLSLDEREVGGLGILMVKNMMDDVHYEYKDKQNRLTIMKRIT